MTDANGAVVWRADYRPFGEEQSITGTLENNEKFVGKEKDKETGLYYFGARYMRPEIGRFITTDPVGPVDPRTSKTNYAMLANPQRLNRYVYSLNNPYRYVDPDGKWPEQVHKRIIERAFSGNLSPAAIAALQRGSAEADSPKYQDPSHSYMHAMRAPNQDADEAAGRTVTFIMEKVAEYKSLMAAGQEDKAYEALGMAMHPLMDATSPSHEGIQEWAGMLPVVPNAFKAIEHGIGEKEKVFYSDPGFSRRAVDSIRKVYDETNR
ncbi:MAG: hypothetical protein M1497_03050 [Nitrospirae bacterium]|nr:hypothetical protein [Nitrospirota bacterium]